MIYIVLPAGATIIGNKVSDGTPVDTVLTTPLHVVATPNPYDKHLVDFVKDGVRYTVDRSTFEQ